MPKEREIHLLNGADRLSCRMEFHSPVECERSHLSSGAATPNESLECSGKGNRIGRRDQVTCLALHYRIDIPANRRCYYRSACRHRLDQCVRESLSDGSKG